MVNKAKLNASNFTYTAPEESLTYDGKVKTATVKFSSTLIGVGGITVKYYDASGNGVTSQ